MFLAVEQLQEEAIRFDEVFVPGHIDYEIEGLSQAAGLHVKGVASLLDTEIHVQGRLGTEVKLVCARCLEPVRQVVDRVFDLFYHPIADCPNEEELHVPKGEEELGFYQGEGLLLEDVAKEQVILALPMRTLCRDDCRGLCPQCGCNRNRESCGCAEKAADPRWEALKKISK